MDTNKYLPNPELKAEFEQFKLLKTDEEKRVFQKERKERVEQMNTDKREAYLSASTNGLNTTITDAKAFVEKADDIILKDKLGELPEIVSLSYIAKKYFGKSRGWLYQRLNGYLVNGKPAAFTQEERRIFSEALQDISDMIRKTSLSFS